MNKKNILLILLVLCVGFTLFYFYKENVRLAETHEILNQQDFYTQNVQPIFDNKCVACHSCFNSPCQLNLSSFEGLSRGANEEDIYDFPKFKSKKPTRLYIDAHNFKEWKKLGFYKVTARPESETSILDYMINKAPGIETGLQNDYDSENKRSCIANFEKVQFDNFLEQNPAGRMPYGLPKLTDDELKNIKEWEKSQQHPENVAALEAKVLGYQGIEEKAAKWEGLLNKQDLKSRISSRYIYEHLFLAHVYFEELPKIFFRVVRSKTKTGDIQEIATLYPFDDPGGEFFYRLRPVTNTITHKDHIPYMLTSNKFKAWKQDFYEANWETLPNKMPAYGRAGANPFNTFKTIPTKSKYRFMLEEAGYHVMTFIKGPVCRGQTALNVINDHFWVMFIDPDKDALSNDYKLFTQVAKNSKFPAEARDDIKPFADFRKRYWESVGYKYDQLKQNKKIFSVSDIWDGDERNKNSLLTIYRHFDSAHVLRGLRGRTPKTVWVIDYQVFESIYYNLTAGYNVFGPILHQVNTRLFMEMSRLASEDMFLNFLPQDQRLAIRNEWNRDTPKSKESTLKKAVDIFIGDANDKLKFDYPYFGRKLQTSFKPDLDKIQKKDSKSNLPSDAGKTKTAAGSSC